jgi:hypothetical protein
MSLSRSFHPAAEDDHAECRVTSRSGRARSSGRSKL